MSETARHKNAELSVNDWLSNQYTSHRTAVDQYEPFEGGEYETVLSKCKTAILQYVVKVKGEQGARYYVNTTGLDWQ